MYRMVGCHSCRAALRLWWPSFPPDWPSALNFFLVSIFLIFPCFIFFYFSFICCYFLLFLVIINCFCWLLLYFLTSFEVERCLQLCWATNQAFAWSCWLLWCHRSPFASFTCFIFMRWCPLSLFLYFSVFFDFWPRVRFIACAVFFRACDFSTSRKIFFINKMS